MLLKLDRLISGSTFDPATEHCSFRIAATDNATSIIAPVLCREVLLVARQVRFTLASWRGDVFEDLSHGRLDLALIGGEDHVPSPLPTESMVESLQSGSATEGTDPRILRSRQMLMEALFRLLDRKEFDDISVQEIAHEATLNRATFYLHYADKNALLQAMTASRLRALIARRGLSFTDCDGALRAIAMGVCDYLAETTGCPSQLTNMPLEGSIIPVVESMFLEGAAHHPTQPGVDPALVATTAAWAIFGAASRWLRTPDRIPAEEMAAKIEAIVKPIFLTVSM